MRRGIRLAEALLGEQNFQSVGAWPIKPLGSNAELDEWIRLHAECLSSLRDLSHG